jgi:hypothetical protein
LGARNQAASIPSTKPAAKPVEDPDKSFRVRLVSAVGLANAAPGGIQSVVFLTSPSSVHETGGVEYTPNQPIHSPGGIQVYKYTPSRTWSISAKFISRNSRDAYNNAKQLQILRAWRMPYFGQTPSGESSEGKGEAGSVREYTGDNSMLSTPDSSGVNLLGAPPELLYLYAYSSSINNDRKYGDYNINRVPVVLTNLDIDYQDATDYIPIIDPKSGAVLGNFPIILSVSVSVLESHSPDELSAFNLSLYKSGTLKGY